MSDVTTQNKFILLLATLYNVLWFVAIFLNSLVMHFNYFEVSVSTFLIIAVFLVGDIITEIYGYIVMRKILWATIFNLILFTVIFLLINSLPNTTTWPDPGYHKILKSIPYVNSAAAVGILCSSFINTYLISKWKILVKGRYFWLRSVSSTAIAALIFTLIGYSYRVIHLPLHESLNFILTAYAMKLVAEATLSFPCALIARFLKHMENLDVYDHGVNYNPFKY